MAVDLNEIDAWTVSHRRGAGLRLLATGAVLCAPTLLWLVVLGGWNDPDSGARARVMGGMLMVIGVCLAVVGGYWLARARHGIDPAVPTAKVTRRRR